MKKITFTARSESEFKLSPKPVPAASLIPDWWKNQTPYTVTEDNPDGSKFMVANRLSNASPKKCMPMLDGITSGYIISLWADVFVTPSNDENSSPLITWRTQRDVFELHGNAAHQLPHPPGYDKWVFKYLNCWIPKTPPGYSVMITAPAGYRESPFLPVPAVLDSDKSTLEIVFPVWVKSGLSGVVEEGTPIVQLTPFKRESWESEFNFYKEDEYKFLIEEKHFNRTLINHYIKKAWSKKKYS